MCTLTWWSEGEGRYEVFFNRDERKTRAPALPPRPLEWRGVSALAPIDPEAGGTWLVVNEFGFTIALLNWYEREAGKAPPGGWRSRGGLVMGMADVASREELFERVEACEAGEYPPFRLVGFSTGTEGELIVDAWEWQREGRLQKISPEAPLCSSSFETEAVIAGRRERWKAWLEGSRVPTSERHWRFHHGEIAGEGGEDPAPSAWSVRMNRPDAQTWSISHIMVEPAMIHFLYEAERPGLAGAAEEFRAELARSSRS